MRILLWHVHGSWTTSFVSGRHTYLLPVTPGRDADGLGRADTWDWPASAIEVPAGELRDADVDLVVLQRPHEIELAERWLGRRLGTGRDVPAVYVEHNTPKGDVPLTRHPLACRDDIPLVHVTGFNALAWDSGPAPATVIEHGVVDPGERYTGELERAAVAVNEPLRRGRVTGTDLLPYFAEAAPLDVYGMKVEGLPAALGLGEDRCRAHEDLPQHRMHAELARRRVYLHPARWTSLGLSLIEAMHLGMPVVVLGTTEAAEAVTPGTGVVSTRLEVLAAAVRRYLDDPLEARRAGKAAREAALGRYSLDRFLTDWDDLIWETTA